MPWTMVKANEPNFDFEGSNGFFSSYTKHYIG